MTKKRTNYPNPYLPPETWELAVKGASLINLSDPSRNMSASEWVREAIEEKWARQQRAVKGVKS